MKWNSSYNSIAFLLLLALAYIGYQFYKMPKFNDGELAPGFSATLKNGSDFELKDVAGQYILLDFWGSWCGPCRKESPDLVRIHNRFHGKSFTDASNFDIVSVAIETNEKRWAKAIADDGLDWKHHIVQLDRFKGEIAKQYGVREIPTKYLLDKSGNILMVNPTFEAMNDFLDSKLKK